MINIRKVELSDLESFNEALNGVCSEKVYLATSEGISLEQHKPFLENIVKNSLPQVIAENNLGIIGWCDILPSAMEGFTHVGHLGMGIVKEYRGNGLGKRLLSSCIELVKEFNIEKIELEVFSDNTAACNLYINYGFEIEGLKKEARKLNNQYQDIQLMGLWLTSKNS